MEEDIYTRLLALLKTQCGCTALAAVTLDPRLENHLFAEGEPRDWQAILLPVSETWRDGVGNVRRFYWHFALTHQVSEDVGRTALVRAGVSPWRADVAVIELND